MKYKLSIILSAIAAAIVVIVLAVPFGMGLWVQEQYPKILDQFNTPHISFELKSFQRGWFNSRAQLQVTMHSAETTLSGESIPLAQFTVEQNIQHGPFILQKLPDGSRHWITARAVIHNESHADNLNFKASTVWTMSNSLNTALVVEHLLLSDDRQRIEINQLNGNIIFTPADRHFKSQLVLGSGALYENNPDKVGNDIIDLVKVMELDNFSTRLDIRKINTLWYGDRHFEAQKLMIFPSGEQPLTAENFSADLNQNQHEGLTDFSYSNNIASISSGDFKVDQFQLALDLKNMNTPLLENFAQVFIYHSDFRLVKLYSILVDLFTKGMTVNLSKFQFVTNNGPVSLQAQITSPPTDPTNSGLLHLMENLNVQANANVPKPWLVSNMVSYYQTKKNADPSLKIDPQLLAEQYVNYWLTHHLLVPQDQQVTMALNYKDGKLLINGEKPDLANFTPTDSLNRLP